jgi:hypothetical protein
MAANIHLLLGAKYRFLEIKMQVLAKIRSTLSTAATASALSERVAKPEDVTKNIAEVLKDRRIESRRGSAPAQTSVAKAVVDRALLAVGEDRIRLCDLFELILRLRIIRIAVRMIRHRQLAIGALDFDIG